MKKLWIALLCAISTGAFSQEKWNVAQPPATYSPISFTTNEGTWMNLDVSPDGKTIVFDLLGDIYSMPATGGKATPLRTGIPFEVQPRFSPDGKWISFTSDAGGGDNIWMMKSDGTGAKQITKESFRLLNNAVWTPDGEYLIARKHFTSGRSLGAGELWMYHKTGGSGIQLTKRKNDQQDLNEPSVSADGRYVYFCEDMYPGGYFQYNKDPNNQIFVVKRYDREKGETKTILSGPGSACRPTIAKDGKTLAFVKRVRTQSVLCLYDLSTNKTQSLYDQLDKDQMEAWTIFGTYPNMAFSPDQTHLFFWAGGKIKKINLSNKEVTNIPFEVDAKIPVREALHFKNQAFKSEVQVNVVKNVQRSPDGKFIYFQALSSIWKKELPKGIPTLVYEDKNALLFEPQLSADGKKMVFVTWNDESMGSIQWIDLSSKKVTTLVKDGIFREPQFSPDGTKICYRKDGADGDLGILYSNDPGLYVLPLQAGAKPQLITEEGFDLLWKNNQEIYFQTYGGDGKLFKSINIQSKEEKSLFTSTYTNSFVPSPDGKWIAFKELYKVYVAPMPQSGKIFNLNSDVSQVPLSLVAPNGGVNLHWTADSKTLSWTLGSNYFSADMEKRFPYLGKVDSVIPVDTLGIEIGLKEKADVPTGRTYLTNARIITMKGNEVIENGTIVIEGNKIIQVGKSSDIIIPDVVIGIDLKGKTVIPGLVDVHAHVGHFGDNFYAQKHWPYYANLSYGVTTTHDPSTSSERVFGLSELVQTGRMVGPRVFSTGTILYGADGDFKAVINNYQDAYFAVNRTKAFGAFSVKSYNQPRREQRQQVIEAANRLGVQVVPEGGSFFYHNLSQIMDGHTGIEHNVPIQTLYNDVVTFWSKTKTHYTPTLIVAYGAMNGENYWYQHTNVWEEKRLLNFTPRSVIDPRSRHRTMIPEEEYENGHIAIAKHCKKLADAGVKVNLGAHGQIQGIGAHWEMWMLAQGGMSSLEALRCATQNGADYLGMGDQIGSIETGKLADLVVIDGDVLKDIRQSKNITHTMINGVLYDANSMDQMNGSGKKRTPFYWELPGCQDSGTLHHGSQSKCSCRH